MFRILLAATAALALGATPALAIDTESIHAREYSGLYVPHIGAKSLGRVLAPALQAPRVGAPGAGGWAIPEAIVMCESHGQNLAPNGATASGYYQILDSTWTANGGHGSSAYLAPKAEQDRVAANIWASGGPGQWVCKA